MRDLVFVLRTAGASPWRLFPAACLALAADLGAVALMTLAAWLIARAAQMPPMGALSVAIVAVRALAVTRGLFRYGERLAGHDVALRTVARLRGRVFGALARRPATHRDVRAVRDADAVSRLVADVDVVQDALLRVLLPAVSALAVTAATVGCAALVSAPAALVLLTGLAAGGLLVPALTALASARAARRGAALRAELAVRTVDLLDGAADLRAFGAAGREVRRAADTAHRLRAHDRGAALAAACATAALTVVQGVTVIAVTLVCAHRAPGVWQVVLPLLALASFEVLAPLPAAAQQLMSLPASAHRVRALLDVPAEAPAEAPVDAPRSAPADASTSAPTDAPTSAPNLEQTGSDRHFTDSTLNPPPPVHLSLRNLHIRHRPTDPYAVSGVDLDLPPGHRVAIVGASGAGKSTLLAAVARLVAVERGELLLDGADLNQVPEAVLRRTVSGALQDAHVFHTSVRNNLLPARPHADDTELHDALRRAGLLDWVLTLPGQLGTVVGADGGRLSGGQRQRLILARALLAAPSVLLLDEPTEGVDRATADAVLADVLASTRGRSLILVTHRTEGLEAMDEILVMAAGRVIRRGTPADVLPQLTSPRPPQVQTVRG
ncbi:thiol reductant ABC exporter subunit CydC [Streptomyces sp. NPDC050418]|uniref:thiol reductant ABC exporter subunit CydC n=1 Tax=Streptomyces sp. NPDC050418 TaxID=3365612 RepID=UPI00379164E9